MTRKKKSDVESCESAVQPLPKRLCSEIQLFDLCELERCGFKDDRFCTDPEMIARFEAVVEPEDRPLDLGEEEDEDGFEGDEYEGYDDERYSVFDGEDDLELPDPDDDW